MCLRLYLELKSYFDLFMSIRIKSDNYILYIQFLDAQSQNVLAKYNLICMTLKNFYLEKVHISLASPIMKRNFPM